MHATIHKRKGDWSPAKWSLDYKYLEVTFIDDFWGLVAVIGSAIQVLTHPHCGGGYCGQTQSTHTAGAQQCHSLHFLGDFFFSNFPRNRHMREKFFVCIISFTCSHIFNLGVDRESLSNSGLFMGWMRGWMGSAQYAEIILSFTNTLSHHIPLIIYK